MHINCKIMEITGISTTYFAEDNCPVAQVMSADGNLTEMPFEEAMKVPPRVPFWTARPSNHFPFDEHTQPSREAPAQPMRQISW